MLFQRVVTALLLAPLAILIILLLPTPWLAAVGAVVFLGALEEWARLAGVRQAAVRVALLVAAVVLFALLWSVHAGLPTTVLIDPRGKVIARAEGPAEWASPASIAYFRSLK